MQASVESAILAYEGTRLGLFGLEQGFQVFLVTLGFWPEQPGHRGNLGRKPNYCGPACGSVHRLSSHSQKECRI